MMTALDFLTQDSGLKKDLKNKKTDSLSQKLKSEYELLKKNSAITHFYFHGPDRVNLYRMHEPDHFGDKIDRQTLINAEKTGLPAYGVEQGPTGASVLRVVYPVTIGGQRVGYFELGKEFQDITNKIRQIMGLDVGLSQTKSLFNRIDGKKETIKPYLRWIGAFCQIMW